jgi:hypothetical protein
MISTEFDHIRFQPCLETGKKDKKRKVEKMKLTRRTTGYVLIHRRRNSDIQKNSRWTQSKKKISTTQTKPVTSC